MKNKTFKNIAFILFLAIVVLSLTSCPRIGQVINERTSVSVSGRGTVYLEADLVNFSVNIHEKASTTAEAQQAVNKNMTAVLNILKEFKIEDKDISTTALNFSTDYYWESGKQIKDGESVSQTVYVTMRNLNSFPSLADALGTRLTGIQFYNVSFDSTRKAEASKQARELAYKDALEKAQLYAKQAGLEVSRPVNISEDYTSYANTSFKRSDLMAMEAAADTSYATQTPTGLLSAEIAVNVVFELK